MRDTITCPSCHARLWLPDEPPPGGMSCPRCLAPLKSAGTAIQSQPGVTETVPPVPVQGLARKAGSQAVQSIDREADGDSKKGFGWMSLLIGLCIGGILLAMLGKGSSEEGFFLALIVLMVLFGVLDVLVLIKIGLWLKRRSSPRPARDAGEAFLKIVTTVFAFLGLALATIVFFFFACLGAVSIH